MKYPLNKIRKEFPFLETHNSLIYFDSAATSQKPRCVIDSISKFLKDEYGTVHRAIYGLASGATARYNEVRQLIATWIGAKETSEIVFTKGTTEGINLVASSFGKQFMEPGDEILVIETEHHSNIVPWQLLAKDRGVTLKVCPVDDTGSIDLSVLDQKITSKTKLVAVAHIANSTGTIHPIEKIIQTAHQKGAKVLVDAAQSVAHLSIDVTMLDVDFLVFSGHKMYGPTGIGILYGKKELLELMPPYQGGGDMVQKVSFEETTYQSPPLRFEAGTPGIVEVMGLGAAVCFLEEVGLEEISNWEKKLSLYAFDKLSLIPGLRFLTKGSVESSIITFSVEGYHPFDIGTLLDLRNIAVRTGHLCAQPALKRFQLTSAIRVSFGVYNTLEEVDSFVDHFQDVLKELKA